MFLLDKVGGGGSGESCIKRILGLIGLGNRDFQSFSVLIMAFRAHLGFVGFMVYRRWGEEGLAWRLGLRTPGQLRIWGL